MPLYEFQCRKCGHQFEELLTSAEVEGGKVKVSGIPLATLLKQLSVISLSGENADPLAELSMLGDAVDEAGPEGGGSIRATNKRTLAGLSGGPDAKEVIVPEGDGIESE